MIVQLYLPFDAPGLGEEGDVVVANLRSGKLERCQPLPDSSWEVLLRLNRRLYQVGTSMDPERLEALLRAAAPPARDRPLLRLA